MFEPEKSFISSTLDAESDCKNAIEFMSLESTLDCWCLCQGCEEMKNKIENFCCKNDSQVRAKLSKDADCITKLKSFLKLCLDQQLSMIISAWWLRTKLCLDHSVGSVAEWVKGVIFTTTLIK